MRHWRSSKTHGTPVAGVDSKSLRARDIDSELQKLAFILRKQRDSEGRREVENKINALQEQRVNASAPYEYREMLAALG